MTWMVQAIIFNDFVLFRSNSWKMPWNQSWENKAWMLSCTFWTFFRKYYAHFCFWPKKRLSKSYETLETAQSWTKSWLSVFITLFAKISVHLFLQNGNLEVSWLAPNMPEMRLRNFLTLLALKCFIVPKTIKMSCMMRAKKAISLAARGVIVAPVIRGFND